MSFTFVWALLLLLSCLVHTELARGWRDVWSFAGAHSIDLPWSGSSFGQVELRSTLDHCCSPVTFVTIDVVGEGVLHLLGVHVGSQSKDMEVIGSQDSCHEV